MPSCHNVDKLPHLWKASDTKCNVPSWCISYRAPCCWFVYSSAFTHAACTTTIVVSGRPAPGWRSLHSNPNPQAQIHRPTVTADLEACPCIPKQQHLPQTAQQAKKSEEMRNVQVQKTQKFPRMERDLISRARTDRIPPYMNLHFNMWDNGRYTFHKYIKFTHGTKRQILDWFSIRL